MRNNQGAFDPTAETPIVRTDLSTAEAATRLGISESTVRRRIRQGDVPAVKVGGVWRITLVDVAESESSGGSARPAGGQIRSAEEQTTRALAADAPAHLAAMREAFLQPVVEQLAAQAEEIGRLRAERDHLRAELERLGSRRATTRARLHLERGSSWRVVTNRPRGAWLLGGLVGVIGPVVAWWWRRTT